MLRGLVTCADVEKAAEQFIAEHRPDFPIGVQVKVIDRLVPGEAALLLGERFPKTLRGALGYAVAVSLLRWAKRLDEEAR